MHCTNYTCIKTWSSKHRDRGGGGGGGGVEEESRGFTTMTEAFASSLKSRSFKNRARHYYAPLLLGINYLACMTPLRSYRILEILKFLCKKKIGGCPTFQYYEDDLNFQG